MGLSACKPCSGEDFEAFASETIDTRSALARKTASRRNFTADRRDAPEVTERRVAPNRSSARRTAYWGTDRLLAGSRPNETPVSSSETSQRRRATSRSCERSLDSTLVG